MYNENTLSTNVPVWVYWEGPKPHWIELCHGIMRKCIPNFTLLSKKTFRESYFKSENHSDNWEIQRPNVQSDFIRAHQLRYYGGIWLDSDCIMFRDISPIWNMLKEYNFISYKITHPNKKTALCSALIASYSGSPIAKHYFQIMCNKLKTGEDRPLGNVALGPNVLVKAVNKANGSSCGYIPTEQIHPISWLAKRNLWKFKSDAAHSLDHNYQDPYCFMLTHRSIGSQKNHTKDQILNDRTVISFMFRKALNLPDPNKHIPETPQLKVYFKLQPKNLWHGLLMPKRCSNHCIEWVSKDEAELTVVDFRYLEGIVRKPDILFIPTDSPDLHNNQPHPKTNAPGFARDKVKEFQPLMILRSIQFKNDIDNELKAEDRWLGAQMLYGSSSLPERNELPSRAINALLWHPHIKGRNFGNLKGPDRNIDLFYYGTGGIYFKDKTHINIHRQLAIEQSKKLRRIKVDVGSQRIPVSRFLNRMSNSKIALSPWGFGPLCYRDFEAALRRCTIIKPYHDVFETTPNPLIGHTVYHCKPDFSNLEEVVDEALKNWQEDYERNEENSIRLLQMFKTPSVYFQALNKILLETKELKNEQKQLSKSILL